MSGKSELKTRFLLGPAMLLIIGGVYWLDVRQGNRGNFAAVLLGLLALGGVHELIVMFRRAGYAVAGPWLLVVTASLCSMPFWFQWTSIDHELYPMVISTFLLLFPIAVSSLHRDNMVRGLELQGGTLLAFIFVVWPLYIAQGMALRHVPAVLFVILVCKGGDIGGYLSGVAFGKHKLIPHVSAGKTIEGALGSLVMSIGLSVALGHWLLPTVELGLTLWVLVGIMLNLTTQTGDLIESLLKRRCGVKDSSALLPAHGGILDLIDSLLFSFPAFFLVLVCKTGP